jgi:16S rRNA (cytosine967-C5)-methyltransferase
MGVLRWRSRLDEAISSLSSQKLNKLDPEVLEALRLAAYQIGFLERIPAHAAVNDSVELVKRKKKRSAAPFVNAVLRKLLARKDVREPVLSTGPLTIPDLVLQYAHPMWLVDRWAGRYGLPSAAKICEHNQSTPQTSIRSRDETLFKDLEAEGIQFHPGVLLRSARRVVAGDVTKTRAFAEGKVSIQDEASQLVALLVGRGERLLDCCAAPGGKTAILAEQNPTASILAGEIHEARAIALRQRLSRYTNVEVVAVDATSQLPSTNFDRVLADVPCSGTGTLSRNPEIKWRLVPDDLQDLHNRQVAILESGLAHLEPGGRLVYSTCSLEPEENEQVIEQVVLRSSAYTLVPADSELKLLQQCDALADFSLQDIVDGPFLRTLPGELPVDGFFAAIIQKK